MGEIHCSVFLLPETRNTRNKGGIMSGERARGDRGGGGGNRGDLYCGFQLHTRRSIGHRAGILFSARARYGEEFAP